jgi:rhodanese-related sulfurtransferase
MKFQTIAAAVLGAIMLVLAASPGHTAEPRINADEAYRRTTAGELLLIDVRSPQEWQRSGIPRGSVPISMHQPGGAEGFKKAILAATKGNKTRPIALICAVGGRSGWAQRFLSKEGFTNVQDVTEGMFGRGKNLPGWLSRGLPVDPCPNC